MNEWKKKCVGLQWTCVSKRTVYGYREGSSFIDLPLKRQFLAILYRSQTFFKTFVFSSYIHYRGLLLMIWWSFTELAVHAVKVDAPIYTTFKDT